MEKDILAAEKIIKKIIKNVFRNSQLDYTVQVSTSSVEPGKVKYSALITSPSRHVQEIPFRFNSFDELKAALETALKEFKYEDIEKAEVQSRITVYENKAQQLKDYLDAIEERGLDDNGFLNEPEEATTDA